MEEQESRAGWTESADIHVCIFPHLDHYLVIDIRADSTHQPSVRVLKAEELLDDAFFKDVETEFSKLLRTPGQPFLSMIVLPEKLEALLRWMGSKKLTDKLQEGDPNFESPRVALLLCTGPILSLDEGELEKALGALFAKKTGEAFAKQAVGVFMQFLGREKLEVRKLEQEALRKVVTGDSDQFFTMWEKKDESTS